MSKVLVVGNVLTLSTGKSMPAPVVLGVDQRGVDRGRSLQMLCEQSWKKKEQAEQHNNTIPNIDMYPSAAIEVLLAPSGALIAIPTY